MVRLEVLRKLEADGNSCPKEQNRTEKTLSIEPHLETLKLTIHFSELTSCQQFFAYKLHTQSKTLTPR